MEDKLKVLWLTFHGSWTLPLINQLKRSIILEIIVPTTGKTEVKLENNVVFHYIQIQKKSLKCNMTESIAKNYLDVINSFKPDLIHVHGTEKNLAQINRYCPNIPIVVSIQGILKGCIPYATNGLTTKDMLPFKSLKNIFGYGGLYAMYNNFINGEKKYETDILTNTNFFFCRTNWDKEWVKNINPTAEIFQGEELLRQPFYDHAGEWNILKCRRHRIFMPAGFNPMKGLHIAVEVVKKLKSQYPDVILHVPGIEKRMLTKNWLWQHIMGEEYIRYVLHKIRKYGLEDNIFFYGRLDAEQMAKVMLSANVFLSPSSIDNSPNSVGEAMLLGLPIVATPVGGVPSFIHHDENGLLATPELLADNINKVFHDDLLATKLGKAAYSTALKRHNRESAKQQYLEAYRNIIKTNSIRTNKD